MNGYITYLDENPKYKQLSEILIESILSFSDKHVEVFSINFDFYHSSNRVHSRRVDIKRKTFFEICNVKLYAAFNSMFDLGIVLDSDVIITKETDSIFKQFNPTLLDCPIAPLHPVDVTVEKNILDILGVKKKTQHYVHADTFIYSDASKKFLEECYQACNYLIEIGVTPSVVDETILNAMLWKYEKTNSYTDVYDPYYECFLNFTEENLLRNGYKNPAKVRKLICHGCKDVILAKKIYERLLNE